MNQRSKKNSDSFTVKDLPEAQQPYEKCEKYGASFLTDAELLAVIIRSGSKKEHSIDLAYRILAMFEDKGIAGLCHADMNGLTGLFGIGRVKALQLMCVAEIAKRIAKSAAGPTVSFDSARSVAMYYMEDMRHLEREQTLAVFLDAKMNLICDRVIFKGTVNFSMFEPRDILIEALRAGAVSMIMLHNHPTGDPKPSEADISATVRLRQACLLVGIRLSDHIVIGNGTYTSMREAGVI